MVYQSNSLWIIRYLQKFESVDHFRKELEEYINYYNNKRIKTALNNMRGFSESRGT